VDAHPALQLNDFITALEKLGIDTDWCPTAAEGQALPKITGHISCNEPRAAGLAE
jgi:hypothetical protein